MKIFLRVLSIILSIISAISLTTSVYQAIFRAARRDWLITTAEITFIGTPDGVVFGTFTDCNGKVHSEHLMYLDGKFKRYFALTPWAKDPKPYIGTTVRIMYDPSTLPLEERSHSFTNKDGETIVRYGGIKIKSYDNWLRRFIVSVSVFGVSAVLLAVVFIISIIRKRAEKKPEGENGTENV